jgi:hypothetical protein
MIDLSYFDNQNLHLDNNHYQLFSHHHYLNLSFIMDNQNRDYSHDYCQWNRVRRIDGCLIVRIRGFIINMLLIMEDQLFVLIY